MSDNYQIFNPSAEFGVNGHWEEVDIAFRPNSHTPTRAPNLKRGYGWNTVYDRSDGIGQPQIITLSATLEFESEEHLSAWIEWWMWYLSGATRYKRRSTGEPQDIRSAWLTSAPSGDEGSNIAALTINLVPSTVLVPRKPTGKLRGF